MGSRNLLVTEKSPLKVKIYEAKADFASKTAHKALPPTLGALFLALRGAIRALFVADEQRHRKTTHANFMQRLNFRFRLNIVSFRLNRVSLRP